MGTITDTFALAWKHHQANDLQAAERLYRAVVQSDSSHADAWCFLGAACQAQGKLMDAETAFRRAIELYPNHACALNCLGILLAQQGKHDAAAAAFQRLLDVDPTDADGYNNLGLVRMQQARFDEAIVCCQRALRLRPDFAAAQSNLREARKLQKAERPLTGVPDFLLGETCSEAARAAVDQGVKLAKQGKMDEAKIHFEQATLLHPENVDAQNDLGSVLVHEQRYEEAASRFQKVLSLKPDHVVAHYNLAIALHKQGKLDEALACYRQALSFQPEHLDAQNNLGNLYKEQARLDEAQACYEQALRWHPQHPGSHFNRALAWLLEGQWARGWQEYEWRWHTNEFPPYEYQQPRWDGAPLAGRTIVVFAEQGLGDTLQFIRYLPLVKERGGKVIFICQAPLIRLLARVKGIDQLVPRGSPVPQHDVQAPLLSLPGIFRTTIDNVPSRVAYLEADSKLVEYWKRELAHLHGFKIGISWQGRPTFRDDRRRSIPLTQFESLARLPGVQLISLQKGPGAEQLQALGGKFPVHSLGNHVDEANGSFMDTAAIIKNLDLVISSDTAVPHLAGALGAPVWLALPLSPDWRWLLQGQESPWYPTMQLFRQCRQGKWADVFESITKSLKESVAKCVAI